MGRYLQIFLAMAFCIISSEQQICSITNNRDINVPSDLSVHTGKSQENCCSICQDTTGCKGYVYNENSGGTCWLKTGTDSVIAKNGVHVGILHGIDRELDDQDECSIKTNEDINLTLLASHSGQPQENCCSICRITSGCKSFYWNAYEGGTCWLKAETETFLEKDNVHVGCSDYDEALVTFNEFANAVVNSNGYPRPSQDQYNAFIQGLAKGLIASKQEAAMALTHFLHESDGLRAKREYRCVNNGCPGEYQTPGCDASGQHYFGRGYIQLSWCYNYRAASQDLFNDNRMVSDPDMVAREESLAWNTAFWFWKVNVHNVIGVSEGDFGVTTRAINGNLECNNSAGHSIARHRYEMYGRIRAAWSLPGPGIERGCYN